MAGPNEPFARPRSHARIGRVAAAGLVVLAAVSWTIDARAGDEQEVESVRLRLEQSQNQDAANRLARMLDTKGAACQDGPDVSPDGCRLTDAEMVKKARGYYAIALFVLGRAPEARDQIDELLRQVAREEQDPNFRPSPSVFPQKVFDLIVAEQTRIADELARIAAEKAKRDREKRDRAAAEAKAQADYVKQLEAIASNETIVDKHSRWIAAIPFGVGQYQNDSVGLGLVFTLSQTAFLTTSIATTGVLLNLDEQAIAFFGDESTQRTDDVDQEQLSKQRNTLRIVNNVSLGLFAVSAIAGIIEAEANYKDSIRHERKRPLPKRRKVTLVGVPGAADANGLGLKLDF